MRTDELCFVCGKNEDDISSAYQILSPGSTAAKLVVSIVTESNIDKITPEEIDTDVICSACIIHLKYIDDCTNKINETKKIIIELYSLGMQIFSSKRTGSSVKTEVIYKDVSID